MNKKIRFNHVAPQFVVKEVVESIDFYKKVLGFEIDYKNGSPLNYAVVYKNEVYIHLCLQKTRRYKLGPGCCFISISNVEKLWDQVCLNQVDIVQPLKVNNYSKGVVFKDFIIKDPDDNILRIGKPVKMK